MKVPPQKIQREFDANHATIQAAVNEDMEFWMVGSITYPYAFPLFAHELESTHYHWSQPGRNQLLTLFHLNYMVGDEEGTWGLLGIPKADWPLAEALGVKYNIKLVRGLPQFIVLKNGSKVTDKHFPISGQNIFTAEPISQEVATAMAIKATAAMAKEALRRLFK